MKLRHILMLIPILTTLLFAQEKSQTFLSLQQTGVEQFLQQHPEYDGRGTIILVLDTGVDMGIDGLTKNSEENTKVIDVQDFTGQGDIEFFEADTDDDDDVYYFLNEDNNLKVAGANKLALKPVDGNYFIGVINEKLWLNSGSGASDVNGNDKLDDKFHFVTFKTEDNGEQFWVVYFDTDADQDLSNEKPLRTYKENLDEFFIKNYSGLPEFTLGLNIFPEKNMVSFYFDDGSHGTHCAGIAAGYKIGDNEFNGVAPGAEVMGLKLGNNNYAGGATVTESMKKAYLYADKISKETKKPCIINMSFGIGSELEGRADIEKFIDDLVSKNPYLYVCTSNGNEGPGLSTAGIPSALKSIFSSGAVLTKEVAQDLYGGNLDRDIILHFSSRGGEVGKPDVVAPGACTSTVPNFSGGDRFWGTSMASPYTTGVMSILLSALNAEFPDVKVPARLLYKAVREGAVQWDEYDAVDQGGGFVNVENAYKLIKKYIKEGQIKKFETYTTSALSPNMPDGTSENLYIRNGSYITSNETFNYTVRRDNVVNSDKFYRIYNLKSDKDWLIPVRKNTYIRNNQSAAVTVKFDKSKMTEPGLYNGVIKAFRNDKTQFPEFELMATVVVPYEFNAENNYKQTWTNKVVKPGELNRYFVNVPAGATNMKVKFFSNDNEHCYSWYFLHDPDGRQMSYGFLKSEVEGKVEEKNYHNLTPGVYEIDVLGRYDAQSTSTYNISIEFDGVNLVNEHPICASNNSLDVINEFNELKSFNLSGKLQGYQKEYAVELDGKDKHIIEFTFAEGETYKNFELALSKEDYSKTTDFAVMIFDENDVSVASGGFSYHESSVGFRNPNQKEGAKYRLALLPGFANAPSKMTIRVNEKTYIKSVPFGVKNNNRTRVSLYPSITTTLDCSVPKTEFSFPEGVTPFGKITFKSRSNNSTELELPVTFKF